VKHNTLPWRGKLDVTLAGTLTSARTFALLAGTLTLLAPPFARPPFKLLLPQTTF
jgi:hypothetical protein